MKIKPEITIQNIKINKVLADAHVSMFVCVCIWGGGGGGRKRQGRELGRESVYSIYICRPHISVSVSAEIHKFEKHYNNQA